MTQEEWKAIWNKDMRYDGKFWYALKTTKTICRPSCPSRLPNPKNVLIFRSLEDGIAQGFRPCRRCRPDYPDWPGAKAELAWNAKEWIEANYAEKFSSKKIADTLHVNGSYLMHTFKEITGMTMLQYHNYCRCMQAKKLLESPELSLSYISCQIGYASSSHFTQVFKKTFGYTPSEYRRSYLEMLNNMIL